MSTSFTKENILGLISLLDGYESVDVEEAGEAFDLTLTLGAKSVCVKWPYEIGEVFLDYKLNGDVIFQDWFECLQSDELSEFVSYIEQVSKRYLQNEARVKKKGSLFRSNELQYCSSGVWLNVLHP